MAMGKEAIEQCRNTISYFNNGWDNAMYRTYLDNLLSDLEYQKFISQTDIGRSLNDKLVQTMDLYGTLWDTLGDLGDKTRDFLNSQESLNNNSSSQIYGGVN